MGAESFRRRCFEMRSESSESKRCEHDGDPNQWRQRHVFGAEDELAARSSSEHIFKKTELQTHNKRREATSEAKRLKENPCSSKPPLSCCCLALTQFISCLRDLVSPFIELTLAQLLDPLRSGKEGQAPRRMGWNRIDRMSSISPLLNGADDAASPLQLHRFWRNFNVFRSLCLSLFAATAISCELQPIIVWLQAPTPA